MNGTWQQVISGVRIHAGVLRVPSDRHLCKALFPDRDSGLDRFDNKTRALVRLLTVHCTHNNYKNIFPNCKAADPVNNIYG